LSQLRTQHRELLLRKSGLDKDITQLTELVLLSPTRDNIVFLLFHLADRLLSRYTLCQQPDDIKSSVKYFRFLRIKFHSLEAFDIPHTSGDLPSSLCHALACNFVLTPDDMVLDFEEMVALIPEIVTTDTLAYHQRHAMKSFSQIVAPSTKTMFHREDTQQVANRAIQVLREAMVLNPDLYIAYALATCLAARFENTLSMNDFEEATAIAGRIAATHSPGNSPTTMETNAMLLISVLLVSRLESSSRPDYFEDAIHRIRAFLPCFPDDSEARTMLVQLLDGLTQRRFEYFGVVGNSDGIPVQADPHFRTRIGLTIGEGQGVQMDETVRHLTEVIIAIKNGEIADVEAAVARSRKLVPLQQSSDHWSPSEASELTKIFADLLFEAYQCTKRSNYLDEAITTLRALRHVSAPEVTSSRKRFIIGFMLYHPLLARLQLSFRREDIDELIQLCSELANDNSWEVFTRFEISCSWAVLTRANLHPSASTAYETAMSLLQETLVFCPTLQTQHYRLSLTSRDGGTLPSNYASYQIENGQVEQAIETLERGRALIWSEMRGLRTSTDRLRAADPAIADKFADINQRLESVTMSVAQSDGDGLGLSETGTGRREHTIGHLVLTQRRLLDERNSLISHIQSLPDLEDFLKPLSFDVLNSAAACGPVIIINLARPEFPSYIILLLKDSPPSIIPTPPTFHDRADQLENELLRVRKEKGLDSEDYDRTLASTLSDLYELVGKPVIKRLRELKVPEKSRVWWCPTSSFCSLPLHAMGPIPSDDSNDLYFSDLYIPSYTPTLAALIESRKRGSSSLADSKPSILLVAQPDTLPGAFGEIMAVKATKTPMTALISAMATPKTVIEGLRDHRFAHFVCHGGLETGKPFDASLELHKDSLTLMAIVRSQLPAAEFAFLAACHTAELTEGSVSDEGLHLAAAMQYCGFRSVVGTMWAMADTDGEDLSQHFYKAIFADKADQNGMRYHERSAGALQIAVKKLRKKRGMTLERWVNFVHYGA
jgi:CHAT domain-containing protein